jgi:hypothetical protein
VFEAFLAVASQDPSEAITTPPTWALWALRMARGVPSEVSRGARLWKYPDGPGYGVQGVRASDEVVGQAMSPQVSAPS